MTGKSRALFLDRDGVFNELIWPTATTFRAPWSWKEVRYYPGLEVLQVISERGGAASASPRSSKRSPLLFLVTNQPDLERKLVDPRFVDDLNGYFAKKYHLEKVYCCPFSNADHPDKKPNPGMLLRAAEEYAIDLKASWFLGDTASDTVAASRAGCRSLLIDRPYNRAVEAGRRIFSYSELPEIVY